jgi:hypothetical protein
MAGRRRRREEMVLMPVSTGVPEIVERHVDQWRPLEVPADADGVESDVDAAGLGDHSVEVPLDGRSVKCANLCLLRNTNVRTDLAGDFPHLGESAAGEEEPCPVAGEGTATVLPICPAAP